MNEWKTAFLCARINFRKWIVTPRIWVLAVFLACFLAYNSSGLVQLASAMNSGVTPWVFPGLFLTPVMVSVFGCFTMLLFCDAPFLDRHTPFVEIRTGRKAWILGQLLYIILASLVYTVYVFLVSVLVLVPHLELSGDWGVLLRSLAADSSLASQKGIALTVFADPVIVGQFSGPQATLIACAFFWLVAVLVGVLIFAFNIMVGKMSGLVAAGAVIALSYYSVYLAQASFHNGWIFHYVSPLNWCSISNLNWGGNTQVPSPVYALIFSLSAIILLSIFSVISFFRNDLPV